MKKYYFDMDGVLANFDAEPNAVERYAVEEGFFKRLKPINEHLDKLKSLLEQGESVSIITASPNDRADRDKKEWLNNHIKDISKLNIHIVRVGANKSSVVKDISKEHILFDDYGKNCLQWEQAGGTAVKIG
jgi:5'(3')-deoxyribonucleotidase